mgnify:CR=1 FL=1
MVYAPYIIRYNYTLSFKILLGKHWMTMCSTLFTLPCPLNQWNFIIEPLEFHLALSIGFYWNMVGYFYEYPELRCCFWKKKKKKKQSTTEGPKNTEHNRRPCVHTKFFSLKEECRKLWGPKLQRKKK